MTENLEDVVEVVEISEKERERRRKISEYRKKVIAEKRKKGLEAYYRRLRKEKRLREKKKQKEKERAKKKRQKEAEKKKKKRPVGRPKKRGPKRKYWRYRKKEPKKRGKEKLPPIKYKIISCKNGKQNKFIGKYRNSEDAHESFNKLKEVNETVIFPTLSTGVNTFENSIDEYLLIEKNDNEISSMFRNEYGVNVENKTNVDGWVIIDKFRYYKEETFSVFGYDNRSERKTFLWIYQNIVLSDDDPSNFKMIYTYKNKLVIKSDIGTIDIVFCKSAFDSVRFYNLLQTYIKKDKIKRILFIGDYSKKSKEKKRIEDELMEVTGFSRRKIQMRNNSYFNTKK